MRKASPIFLLIKVSLLITTLITGAGTALAASLPQPTFVGVGQRDGDDRLLLTFANPLPLDITLAEHIVATVDDRELSDWALGPQRRVAWLLDVPPGSTVQLQFVDRAINREVFSQSDPGRIKLAARQPSVDVAGVGPVIALQDNPSLPLRIENVDAVQLELLKVTNPDLVARQLSPFDIPSTYWLNALSGAFESLGVSERLTDTSGTADQLGLPLALDAPGWYMAVIKPAGRFGDDSTIVRQILYTDLAIRVMRFERGVSVNVTRYSDGTVVSDANVTLSSADHSVSDAVDAHGSAYFAGDFDDQTLVSVRTAGDQSYLPLSATPLDLDDYAVAGAAARDAEVFATANRDLVAPGASITVTAILRGHDGAPLPSQPLQVRWRDPLGETQHSERQRGNADGLWQFTHRLPASARPGLWRALFYTDPNSRAVGEFSFNVDHFVPERIAVSLPELAQHNRIDDELSLQVSAQYLHGASANGLPVEADLGFRSAWKTAVPGWHIGKRFELYASYQQLTAAELDADGQTSVSLQSPAQRDISAPVAATVSVTVLDGSSRVQRKRNTTLWPAPLMSGIKPAFDDDQIAYRGTARFSVALFELGQPSTRRRQVEVTAYRDSGDGFWVFDDAQGWIYQRQYGQQPVFNKSITIGGEAEPLSFETQWGRYRIEVTDAQSGMRSEYSFYAGWWGADQQRAFKPTGLDARLQQPQPDELTISLNAPYDGTLHAQLVTDQPISTVVQAVGAGRREIVLDAMAAADRQDAYLILTLTGRSNDLPARAMAILPLRWQRGDRHLIPELDLPTQWRPGTEQIVKVRIPGMQQGRAWLMVADKGITNITDYRPLDPFDFIYRKRQLGATLSDLHDRFYSQPIERLTRTRSGGDTVLKRNGPRAQATERITLLHTSKPVAVVDGQAAFNLKLPRYTGEVRVAAVAVDGDRFGQSLRDQRIISPIAIEWRAPEALVHGDKLHTGVLIRNNQKSVKTIRLSAKSGPQISMQLSQRSVTLAPDEQQRIELVISASANAVTVGALDIAVLAETDDETFELPQQLFLRAPGGEAVLEELIDIQPGEEVLLNSQATADWLGIEQELLISTGLPLDVRDHYQRLVGFAYGCSEQTVSQVMSLLLANPEIDRLAAEKGADAMLDAAVSHLYRRQQSGGGISLWDNGDMDEWVSVYVADFLQRLAAQRQAPTLDQRLAKLLAQVQRFVARPGRVDAAARPAVVAYAALISARAGQLDLSTLARARQSLGDGTTASADAQLAQAYFLLGDTQRSEELLHSALGKKRERRWYRDYGSELSDAAQVLIAMGEMRDHGWRVQSRLTTLASDRLKRALGSQRWYSTQERLRLVQAATLWRPSGLGRVRTAGQTRDFAGALYLAGSQFRSLANRGATPLYVSRRTSGYRSVDAPVVSDELAISQRYFRADGRPARLSEVKVGDLIVVSNQLGNTGPAIQNALFVDELPAGFVIENPRLGQGVNLDAWRDHDINRRNRVALDYERFEVKRYSAVFSLRDSATLVYQMRAVAAGSMADPGPSLEDFYAPQRRTTTGSSGKLAILAKQ